MRARRSRLEAAAFAVLIAGCVGAPDAGQTPGSAHGTAAAATTGGASSAPATQPGPTPPTTPAPTLPLPTTDVPAGWRVARTGTVPIAMAAGTVLLWNDGEKGVVQRYDAATLERLADVEAGRAGVFPPDAYSLAPASAGRVWVTLASQGSAVLMDPVTGELGRRITVEGSWPYDVAERDGELWIADYEHEHLIRVDLRTEDVVATIDVRHPSDIIAAHGAIWATVHVGRHDEHEPILNNGGQVARIDPKTNGVTLIDVGPRPYYLASGFGSVWTGNATGGSVSRIDAASNTASTIPIDADGAFGIVGVGDSVWVQVGPQHWSPDCDPETSFFVRIDPRTNTVRERIAFPCPTSLAADGDRLWVTGFGRDGAVLELLEPR